MAAVVFWAIPPIIAAIYALTAPDKAADGEGDVLVPGTGPTPTPTGGGGNYVPAPPKPAGETEDQKRSRYQAMAPAMGTAAGQKDGASYSATTLGCNDWALDQQAEGAAERAWQASSIPGNYGAKDTFKSAYISAWKSMAKIPCAAVKKTIGDTASGDTDAGSGIGIPGVFTMGSRPSRRKSRGKRR